MFKSQDKTNWYNYKHLKEIFLVQNMEAQNIFPNLFLKTSVEVISHCL